MAFGDYRPKRLFQQTPRPSVSSFRQRAAATAGPRARRVHGRIARLEIIGQFGDLPVDRIGDGDRQVNWIGLD